MAFKLEIHIPCKTAENLMSRQVELANMELSDRHEDKSISLILHENNTDGLSILYNKILNEVRSRQETEIPDWLIFCHSDVEFNAYRTLVKLEEYTKENKYDIVGFAGAKVLNFSVSPLGWWTASSVAPNERFGKIQQFYNNERIFSFFNEEKYPNIIDTRVATIDGLCMMLSKNVINDKSIMFDEHFANDFYDLDFCLNALLSGKSIGVLVDQIFHGSLGTSILTEDYGEIEKIFRMKWNGPLVQLAKQWHQANMLQVQADS